MQICEKHWQDIKDLIAKYGLDDQIGPLGQRAKGRHKFTFYNSIGSSNFDSLAMANEIVWSTAERVLPLATTPGVRCPICDFKEHGHNEIITNVVQQVAALACELRGGNQ